MSGSNESQTQRVAGVPSDQKEREVYRQSEQCLPVHIHIHREPSPYGKERECEDEPCININVNVSQCNYRPEFHTCFGDTMAMMNGTGDHSHPGGGSTQDPPP